MKLQTIQLLRSLAAVLVAILHAAGFERLMLQEAGSDEAPLLNGLFLNGYGGVDLFFVISGFIMVWVTRTSRPSPGTSLSFLFARTTRVYPVWWFAAGLMTLYALNLQGAVASPGSLEAEPETYSLGYLVRSFLLLPQPDYPILSVGWTLIHEIYFYVVFAALLLLPRAFLPLGLLVWGAIVIAASFLMPLPATAENLLVLAVHPMTMEFILGAVIGLLVTSGVSWRGGSIMVIAAIWFTAALCLQGTADEFALKWGRVLMFGFPCAALVYGAATLDIQRRTVWLLPALIGAFATGLMFQLNPAGLDITYAERARQLIVPVLTGVLSAAAIILAGWFGGRYIPLVTLRAGHAFKTIYTVAARTGDWSYSLYLTHLFAFGLLKWIFAWLGAQASLAPIFAVGHPGGLGNTLFVVCGLTASLLGGFITYTLVERPALAVAMSARRALFRH